MANIPVVSFAPFLQGNEQERRLVAKQVYEAFSTVGFIYLKDHGVSGASVEQVFNEVMSLTKQPVQAANNLREQALLQPSAGPKAQMASLRRIDKPRLHCRWRRRCE